MKKNRMMRLASILLVCVLLTTSVISGTFAKYTSTATANDKARVAYWGWGSDATIEFDLFDGEYTGVNGETVNSENGDNVVAPGTAKSATFTFAYKPTADGKALNAGEIKAPEVDYDFTVAFDIDANADYDALDNNPNFYWTLNGTEYQKLAELKAAVLKLSGEPDGTARYEAGNLPEKFATAANDAVENTIGWVWEFETLDADGNAVVSQDEADTLMGNAADLDDVFFTITITATQVD